MTNMYTGGMWRRWQGCALRAQNNGQLVAGHDDRPNNFLTGQTWILAGQIMNTMIFFPYMEYQITLAIDRCTALMFRFLAARWWYSFTSCWVPFRGVPPLSCPFIYTLTLSIIVRQCLKSPSPTAAYRWKLIFFVARQVIESLLH